MSVDRKILLVLEQAGERSVLPSELATQLGLSAATITQRIEQMRQLGYEISQSPHLGYQLVQLPDLLHADSIQALLGPKALIGREIKVFQETTSTSDLIEKLAGDGSKEGLVVFAESQTAGRGRLGRKWHSPKGEGLWFSLLLRPALHPSLASQFTIAAATAIARAVKTETGILPELKWPNDLLVNGKKFAGILTELQAELDHIRHLILGIGIDVNGLTFPAELRKTATSLRIESGNKVDRPRLAAAILSELEYDYGRILNGNFDEISDEWESLCSTLGKRVSIDFGGRRVTGLAEALDKDGTLLIRTEHGTIERVIGGDVTLSSSQ